DSRQRKPKVVAARRRATAAVSGAGEVELPFLLPVSAHDDERTAARATLHDAREEVLAVDPVARPAPKLAVVRAKVGGLRRLEALVGSVPEVVLHDTE